jgi:methyl-accepting chemotaxis protein
MSQISPQKINTSTLIEQIPGILPEVTSSLVSFEVPTPLPPQVDLITVSGVVVDLSSFDPLKGAKVISSLNETQITNNKGEFTIKIPDFSNTVFDPSKFTLNISNKSYSPINIIPYKSTKDAKTDLGIISLQPLVSNLNQEISQLSSFSDSEVKRLATKNVTLEFHIQKQFNVSIDELKKIVLPLILGLLAQYGITKVTELVLENQDKLTETLKAQITCPSNSDISKIISVKNKLVHQLNNTLNTINRASKTLEISSNAINGINTAYQILKNIPIPAAVGGVGIPISVINNIQDIKTFLSNSIERFRQGNDGISRIIEALINTLSQIIDFLNLLDKVTQFCSGDTSNQTQISRELTNLTQQQSQQLSPVITNVNGFEMGVETENTEQPLKRRRALARNKQGVVMLKGEWSYSSIDQILINELVFYIQQNNLKAD